MIIQKLGVELPFRRIEDDNPRRGGRGRFGGGGGLVKFRSHASSNAAIIAAVVGVVRVFIMYAACAFPFEFPPTGQG